MTIIRNDTFEGCTALKNVTIPNSITSIIAAFRNCTALTSITIPNSVTNIRYAFLGCTALKDITIPNSVTDIRGAFSGCTALKDIAIPNSVTDISGAFLGCTTLKDIAIPNSVTDIGDGTFSGCLSLTSVTIPNSVTSIGNNAFLGCKVLKDMTIPNSVKTIGTGTFSGCLSLTSVTIPKDAKIGEYAFFGSGVTSVTIEEGVEADFSVFDNCKKLETLIVLSDRFKWKNLFSNTPPIKKLIIRQFVVNLSGSSLREKVESIILLDGVDFIFDISRFTKLKSISLPNSLRGIYRNAFYGCFLLTSLTIPKNVEVIGSNAFDDCQNLESVTFESKIPPTIENDLLRINYYIEYKGMYPYGKIKTINIYVPAESMTHYEYKWRIYKYKMFPK